MEKKQHKGKEENNNLFERKMDGAIHITVVLSKSFLRVIISFLWLVIKKSFDGGWNVK
jgi:hypothetical protein